MASIIAGCPEAVGKLFDAIKKMILRGPVQFLGKI
jgi:hypothetical protein